MRSSSLAFWQWAALIPFVAGLNVHGPSSAAPALSASGSAIAASSVVASSVNSASRPTPSTAASVPLSGVSGSATTPIFASGSASASGVASGAAASGGFTPFPLPSDIPEPSIYPSVDPKNPPAVGKSVIPDFGPAWKAAYEKAEKKIPRVSALTLEEKVSVVTGVASSGKARCVGNTPPIEPQNGRGWPGMCLEDSPLGVRGVDFVTSFPAGINAAASWNRALIRQRGIAMGQEHRGKGVNIQLGPMMNMGRVAQAGRNWEGFGADPFLSGEAAYETILGVQESGVIACAKHLVGNEQETFRTTSSSDIDDRTMHEIYAHPFLKSVMAGLGSMMCSYNLINGTYACENDRVMNDMVKREFGFQGFIMSDWGATHSTHSANQGLDMTMPGDISGKGTSYFGANLTSAVQQGTIPASRVDDMATRIFAAWFLLGQDSSSYPAVNFDFPNVDSDVTNAHIDVQGDHANVVRELGAASTVLLKNKNGALPLGKKDRSIVLIGSDAGPGLAGPNEFSDQHESDGILAMGWGSGTANFTYLITPLEAIQAKARQFHTSVSWELEDSNLPRAGNMARKRSAALVFISADSGEGSDRTNVTAGRGGDALVLQVAAQNNNTIVVVNSVGPLILEPWIDHPNVTAVVWSGLAGQEAGNSLVDILYGDVNPSGRLPYTIARNASDYIPVTMSPGQNPSGTNPVHIPYTEGLNIDYRHFDAANITPRFEFGFGLSYTTFSYSGLSLSKIAEVIPPADSPPITFWESGKATPIAEGSSRALWLHRPAYQATFSIQNTGSVTGQEIPQLYLNFPASAGEPPAVLRGFDNIQLKPGQKTTVTITLSRYDLSIWDTALQGWRKPEGSYGVTIGASSRDAKLKGSLKV
ncbi:hypothetical protein D9619_009183 [Psilocybe cf. subviscida]|uniref:beta-glucosidase n=1 Tax=Psilocybe cf. subviscida TaxID=2480587 RepID=A0A8H5BUB3_9AGAR|nr:hypothetical protein D9619_009183 [Psilocybe cf. subviscida]